MTSSGSKLDRLNRLTNRYPSQAKLQMYRNLCFGAAGTSLLILLVIFQAAKESTAMDVAEIGAAIALPFWFSLGGLFEYYILIGPRSYSHYRKAFMEIYAPLVYLIGGVGLLSAVGGVLYQLQAVALYAFLTSVSVCLGISLVHHAGLAKAIFDIDDDRKDSSKNDT